MEPTQALDKQDLENGDQETVQQFIERVGLFLENNNFPRMAGRILGWLLICDPPLQDMPALAEALQASKSSMSTMTRMLIQFGLVERISIPGERRDYYRIKEDVWFRTIEARMNEYTALRQIAEEGLAVIAAAPAGRKQRLREMAEMAAFFEQRMPQLLEEWRGQRIRRKGMDGSNG